MTNVLPVCYQCEGQPKKDGPEQTYTLTYDDVIAACDVVTSCLQWVVDNIHPLWYLGAPETGFTQNVRLGTRVMVHDDGCSYSGAIKDILIDDNIDAWMQCTYDRVSDCNGLLQTLVDEKVFH